MRLSSILRARMDKLPVTIDCEFYNTPKIAAAYLLKEGKSGAFIDNNTNKAVPILLDALKHNGLTPDQVKYIIVTHIHLDHAGATGKLARLCKNAIVLAHPRAVRHLVDPSQIISGSKQVYGEAVFKSIYGDIEPIDEARVVAVEDGETKNLGESRELQFWHTRGHAKHHFVIHDKGSNSIFTGDTFGISYTDLLRKYTKNKGDPKMDFLFPSASPIDFEAKEAHKSIDKIICTGATRAYLTHFGAWEDMKEGAKQMHYGIDRYAEMTDIASRMLKEDVEEKDVIQAIRKELVKFYKEEFSKRSIPDDIQEIWRTFELDIKLNSEGIVIAAKRMAKIRSKL